MIRKSEAAVISALLVLAVCFCGCAGNNDKDAKRVSTVNKIDVTYPLVTEMADEKTLDEVCGYMRSAGLANVDAFCDEVKEFNGFAGAKANLTSAWVKPDEIKTDIGACIDGWENNCDFSDKNCRMTAFSLLDGLISADKTDNVYDGTYLMFDVDAIENVDRYGLIKEKEALFTSMFGERSIAPGEQAQDVFTRIWNEYGFKLSEDNISLISVVLLTADHTQVFVGHTGVLIELEDCLLFIEKLAFEQPYRVTKLNSLNELIDIFKGRAEYFEGDDLSGTFFYKNDKMIL